MTGFLFLLLHGCVLELAIARLELGVTSSTCGAEHDMQDIQEEAYVTYSGAALDTNECSVQFVNYQVYTKQTCIRPTKFDIGCTTEVEYHRSFIWSFGDPEKLYTCRNASYDEWCGPMRTTRFYLLFRTSGRSSDDDIKMHVYLKHYPGTDTGSTAVDSSTRQGNITQPQPATGYNPAQQSEFQPTVQGGYQFHPMQSAYPVPQQQGYSPVTNDQPGAQTDIGRQSPADIHMFPNPSAPPNTSEVPPPSYESLSK